jgi:ribosome maturation factor RimP
MSNEDQIKLLTAKIEALTESEPDIFLVEIRIKPTNNVKIFLDSDKGISIEKLIRYNRQLYRDLEENAFFPGGDFSLEVSSPGLDEPLRLFRQYQKNVGRYVEVIMNEGTVIEGKLLSAAENEIMIEEEKGKGKKKEVHTHALPLADIKTTKIQVKF